MAYVDENLLPGEHVAYRAHLHSIIYAGPAAIALLAIILIVVALLNEGLFWLAWGGGLLLAVAGVIALITYIKASSSEFAVTNRRVVIKVGVIRRHTLELLLQKVEGIGIDQSVLGRMLDIGTIVVIGTGGTKEQFSNIAAPLKFRHQVQAQAAGGVQPSTVSEVAQSAGGPFCPACGARSEGDANFCSRCGKRLPEG